MRSNLFIQRQKLKQSTVWKTFFVGLFVRQSSKKSASPHPFSVNNCMCQCDRVVLDLLTFYSFCKSFFCIFFSFCESVRIFCPTFYNLRWCVLNTFALHKSKHRFCPLLINECKKRVFAKNRKQMCEPLLLLQKWCHIEVLLHNDQKTENVRKSGKNCRCFAWMSYENSDKKGHSNCRLFQLLLLDKQIELHRIQYQHQKLSENAGQTMAFFCCTFIFFPQWNIVLLTIRTKGSNEAEGE